MSPELRDKTTFKKLYQEYYVILMNFAFSKTRDIELSKEIVQNTFVKIWTRREKLNISTSIKSYLFMMVRNSIIDHFNRNQRITDLDHLPIKMERPLWENNGEDNLVLLRTVIKKALEEMKPKRRLIFELSKYEGLSYSEIAAYLGISERSVEDNMAKALVHIRAMLKPYKNELL